jgi:transcriptional regulator with GAF, ATPase, and Fis domain
MRSPVARGERDEILLKTPRILGLVGATQRVDPRVPLLIQGEPGVGKDVLARLIHAGSPRGMQPFIKFTCSGATVETELFGRERGASSTAVRRILGSFEYAHRGTIYLDEIGALPPSLEPKLLDVLRTGRIRRIGGLEDIPVDVRVIASTVSGETSEGSLRQGLRDLGAMEISLPALRQVPDEVPAFASFFLAQFNRRCGRDVKLGPDLMAKLGELPWTGNLRELEEAICRLAATSGRCRPDVQPAAR